MHECENAKKVYVKLIFLIQLMIDKKIFIRGLKHKY